MPIYTKKLVITWTHPSFSTVKSSHIPPNAVLGLRSKINQMVDEGKTDGIINIIDDKVVERYFIDEAAAQEFIDFAKTLVLESTKVDLGTLQTFTIQDAQL